MNIRDDFYGGEGMIESNDGIKKHEERFGDMKYIFHRPSCSRLEVSNTIISDVANGSSGQRW